MTVVVETRNPIHPPILRGVAAYGLAGSLLEFPTQTLSEEEFSRLLAQVRTQRITGLLWRAIEDGALPVTDAQAERAEWLHVQSLSASLVLERLLLDTLAVLDEAGVPVRVLKGAGAAHLDYPDPALRTFGDVDLIVPGAHFDVAVARLEARGHRRLHPQPRPGFDRRFTKGTSFKTADGLEIDLHRTLNMGPFGHRVHLDTLWAASEAFELAGLRAEALSAEDRFFHACYHAVLGEVQPRLTPLRDLVQIALNRDLDLDHVHDLIRHSKGEAVVAKAVRLAWREFEIADVLAISAWAHAYRTDAREAAMLAAYGAGSSYASKSIATLRSLGSSRDRAAYVYALTFPTKSYLGARHRNRWDRLRTGLRQSRVVRSQP